MTNNSVSLKWNRDKSSMAVSRSFIKKVRHFIRLRKSLYVKNKNNLSLMAWEIYQESLPKGDNRRILYRMLKEVNLFGPFIKMVQAEKENRMKKQQ